MTIQQSDCRFALNILDYESADSFQDHYVQNRLQTQLEIFRQNSAPDDPPWMQIRPLLYTWELSRLAEWLRGVFNRQPGGYTLSFTAPCLAVNIDPATEELPDDTYRFNIILLLDSAPTWWQGTQYQPYTLQIECTSPELDAVATLLDQFSEQYPVRK